MKPLDVLIGQESPSVVVKPPGPASRAASARFAAVESPAFDARRALREVQSQADHGPIVYDRGAGCNVFDVDGNRYVDLVAGFGALPLGHSHPAIVEAVRRQAGELWLALGDVYGSTEKLALCERLASLYPAPRARVMLGLSGADAVTAAMKTAVLATGNDKVIAFNGGYHGLSYAPLTACGLNEGYRNPFKGQLGRHVNFAHYPCEPNELARSLDEVTRILRDGGVGAVLVEPVLGRGGCVVPPDGFLKTLRALCDAHGALLICDEIWTGMGRSGAWLTSVEAGVVPDLICVGKGLGGGMPISACIGSDRAMAGWGAHGGAAIHTATHFGSPLACACAMAMLDALGQDGFLQCVTKIGGEWREAIRDRTQGKGVTSVDGLGLMVGVRIEGGAPRALALSRTLLRRGYLVLTGGTHGDVMTLTPPLTIDPKLLLEFADALPHALDDVDHGGQS